MQDRVKGPAIGLIVMGSLGVLLCIASIPFDKWIAPWLAKKFSIEEGAEEAVGHLHEILVVVDWIMLLLCFFGCVFVIWAGVQMRNLRHHTVALVASVLVMIPCGSSWCCCVGIPIGIWSLLTLTKPGVKAAFTTQAALAAS